MICFENSCRNVILPFKKNQNQKKKRQKQGDRQPHVPLVLTSKSLAITYLVDLNTTVYHRH